jgi:AraC-like DNA-binding protein
VAIVTRGSDGDHGSWTLTESRPAHLAGLIESIWYFEGSIPYARERHLPNGRLGLVVQLDAPFHFLTDGTRERCATACLAGLQTRPTAVEAPSLRSRVAGVRLTPAGAYAVAGSSLAETSGRVVDLGDLVGRGASELVERCEDGRSVEDRVRCVEAWVSARIERSRRLDPRIAWAVARIEQSHGSVAIGELQGQTGLSKKRIIELFRDQVGVVPKVYARIVRFRRALTLLHEGGRSLSNIALDAGYYDQPHMNLEFRELGGLAPSDFLTSSRYSPTTTAG